ncbi:MerR family transcriptional regulator [Arthrobacter oryzae]|jgi:DNA-binding transcriptional MerR regulator|uniref:MerR family transcriptional regulator n=1 Tax=Arthrobacter oryzae TaxID=409290 RepID=UPI00278083DF|nr:MerR family transcriptional regulator [Arthrobacter oryzae]MDQ0079180.1 DNA-binding transcriptional MerR regulator [Arthrobacter oryzae]
MAARGAETGVYAISVVAHLVGTGQQNIRLYERKGLLTPDRTSGGTRQYSDSDLAVLKRIGELLDEGLNLAGIAKVLELEAANARLRAELKRARTRPQGPGSPGATGSPGASGSPGA